MEKRKSVCHPWLKKRLFCILPKGTLWSPQLEQTFPIFLNPSKKKRFSRKTFLSHKNNSHSQLLLFLQDFIKSLQTVWTLLSAVFCCIFFFLTACAWLELSSRFACMLWHLAVAIITSQVFSTSLQLCVIINKKNGASLAYKSSQMFSPAWLLSRMFDI